jgi:hypothetical protein
MIIVAVRPVCISAVTLAELLQCYSELSLLSKPHEYFFSLREYKTHLLDLMIFLNDVILIDAQCTDLQLLAKSFLPCYLEELVEVSSDSEALSVDRYWNSMIRFAPGVRRQVYFCLGSSTLLTCSSTVLADYPLFFVA